MDSQSKSNLTFWQYATEGFLNKLIIIAGAGAFIGGIVLAFSNIDPISRIEDIGDAIILGIFALIIAITYFIALRRWLFIIMTVVLGALCIKLQWIGLAVGIGISVPSLFWFVSYDKYLEFKKGLSS